VEPDAYQHVTITIRKTATLKSGVGRFDNGTVELQDINSGIAGDDMLMYFHCDSLFGPRMGVLRFSTAGGWSSSEHRVRNGLVFLVRHQTRSS